MKFHSNIQRSAPKFWHDPTGILYRHLAVCNVVIFWSDDLLHDLSAPCYTSKLYEEISKENLKDDTFEGRCNLGSPSSTMRRFEWLVPFSQAKRLSTVLTAALYYRVKDKRLLPPAANGCLQLTIHSSTVSFGKDRVDATS